MKLLKHAQATREIAIGQTLHGAPQNRFHLSKNHWTFREFFGSLKASFFGI